MISLRWSDVVTKLSFFLSLTVGANVRFSARLKSPANYLYRGTLEKMRQYGVIDNHWNVAHIEAFLYMRGKYASNKGEVAGG